METTTAVIARADERGRPGMPVLAAGVILLAAAMGGCAGPSAELRAGRPGVFEEGKATYYARRLTGHPTATGEPYDPEKMTAAHHALPLGTWVRVTRLDEPSLPPITVRINDRCAGRRKIIDLSETAARRLKMMRAGIVPVRLEVIAPP